MRFLNSSKSANRRNKNRHTARRRLGGESLEPRLMLSNDSPGLGSTLPGHEDTFVNVPGPNVEPMATISLENGVLKVNGTNNDDVIEIKNSVFIYHVDINTVITFPAIEATLRDANGNVLLTQKFSPGQINQIVIHAFGGDDTVNNATSLPSEIFGGAGNDNLYGGFGVDIIWGEEGNDGLFGGEAAAHNELHGGVGIDRYLKMQGSPQSDIHDFDSWTPIWFSNGTGETFGLIGFQQDATLEPGAWIREEIILVDQALLELHHITGNSKLLKSGFSPISFVRYGEVSSGPQISGLNNGGQIKLTDNAFASGDTRLMQIVFHEVGHNWDEESAFWTEFKALSGWVEANSAMTAMTLNHVPSTGEDDQWYYHDSAKFAREYGKQNPFEDFATSFAAHFMNRLGLPYDGYGAANIPQKNWLIHQLVSSLGQNSFTYSPVNETITTIDKSVNDLQQTTRFVRQRSPRAVSSKMPVETQPTLHREFQAQTALKTLSTPESTLAARDEAFAELGDTFGTELGQATQAFKPKLGAFRRG